MLELTVWEVIYEAGRVGLMGTGAVIALVTPSLMLMYAVQFCINEGFRKRCLLRLWTWGILRKYPQP